MPPVTDTISSEGIKRALYLRLRLYTYSPFGPTQLGRAGKEKLYAYIHLSALTFSSPSHQLFRIADPYRGYNLFHLKHQFVVYGDFIIALPLFLMSIDS